MEFRNAKIIYQLMCTMRGASAKRKDRFSNFSPILFLQLSRLSTLLEKTSLEPERRLGLAILEDTVAYYRRCVEKRNGRAANN
jgi:hypothetical protein